MANKVKRKTHSVACISSDNFENRRGFCRRCYVQLLKSWWILFLFKMHSKPPVFVRRHSSSLRPIWPHGVPEKKVIDQMLIHQSALPWNLRHLGWQQPTKCFSLDRQFSADEVLQLLDRFFNLEMLVTWRALGYEFLDYCSISLQLSLC